MYKVMIGSLLFVGISAMANGRQIVSEDCYMAKNPENVQIAFVSENGETKITEKAMLAEVKLQTVKYDGYDKTQDEVSVTAKSKLLAFNTSAIHFDNDKEGSYGIECDGGRINFTKKNGQMMANSDYLAGEVSFKSAEEGCNGLGSVSMKNIVLEPLACD